MSTKVDISLKKADKVQWKALERAAVKGLFDCCKDIVIINQKPRLSILRHPRLNTIGTSWMLLQRRKNLLKAMR